MNSRIIAFAKDWNDVPTCITHVLRGMGKSMPVLWVSSIGTRKPDLALTRDASRIWKRLAALTKGAQWQENNLSVLWPLLIPKATTTLQTSVNRFLFWLQSPRRFSPPVSGSRFHPSALSRRPAFEYWCSVPNAVDLIPRGIRGQRFQRTTPATPATSATSATSATPATPATPATEHIPLVVYYCVDDWSRFENLDGEWLQRKEKELLAVADVVFTPSKYLADKCRRLLDEALSGFSFQPSSLASVHYVPHGVEHAKFARALSEETRIPDEIATLPKPIVGFYGNLYPWIDFGILGELADARSDWSFVVIGHAYCDVSGLRARSNVHLLARREHDDLPRYCRAFDAAVIPYDVNHPRMTSINPVKTKELLAAGVPLVAADIPELRGYGDNVMIASGLDQWLAALDRQVERVDRKQISESVRGEDWSVKIAQMRGIVDEKRCLSQRH